MTDKVRKTLREYTKDELIEIVGICIDKPQDNLALIRAALSGNKTLKERLDSRVKKGA